MREVRVVAAGVVTGDDRLTHVRQRRLCGSGMGARDARGEEVRGRGDEQGWAVNAERVPASDGDRSRVDASVPGASALNQSRSTTRAAVRRSPGRDIVAVARYDPRAPGVDATPTKVLTEVLTS